MKLVADNAPAEVIEQDTDAKITGVVGDCRTLHRPASAALKPVPPTVTPVPEGPPVGETVVVGAFVVTVKVVLAESPVLPVTVRVYTPGTADVAIVNPLVVNTPLELIVHTDAITMLGVAGDCE